jgi:hypothetical protein
MYFFYICTVHCLYRCCTFFVHALYIIDTCTVQLCILSINVLQIVVKCTLQTLFYYSWYIYTHTVTCKVINICSHLYTYFFLFFYFLSYLYNVFFFNLVCLKKYVFRERRKLQGKILQNIK